MRVVAFGRTKMLLDSIRHLINAGHEIVVIGTCKEAPEYGVGTKDFQELAESLDASFFNTPNINNEEIIDLFVKAKADIAISVNWLTVIGAKTINAFPLGILNSHTGDLPRYRGNACPNWAIIQGENEIAISIHFMEPGELDSGPIVLKRYFEIYDHTTIGEIYQFMEANVPEMFVESIDGLATGTIKSAPQPVDTALALRCYPRIPSDSHINWNGNAVDIHRLIRASSEPFSGAYTYWEEDKLVVWKAYPTAFPYTSLAMPGQVVWRDLDKGEVGVAAGEGVLVLQEVQLEGKGRVKATNIIKSIRTRLGICIDEEIFMLIKRVKHLETIINNLGL